MLNGLDLNKIGNIRQIGGIETAIADNGPARGSRIAWMNTGSGLRYKVAIDRACDIVDAFYHQHSLAWISHGGLTAPMPYANYGLEWLYSFAGGLVTTCGLTHVGPPEDDDNGRRGLHGRISNLPADVESVIQPDPSNNRMDMSLTATIRQSRVFGPALELKRTIAGTLGQPVIRIRDRVTNCGNTPVPHMVLYHCNFGSPLVDEGADIVYRGRCQSRGLKMDDAVFNEKHNYRKCQGVLESHRGTGEACGFIDATEDADGLCTVGLANEKLTLALVMKYRKQQLPHLANWQHWGRGEYVCALEPGTNNPIGQGKAKEQNELIMLEPGHSRDYELTFEILTDSSAIQQFIQTAE
jgi:hypothetical protein